MGALHAEGAHTIMIIQSSIPIILLDTLIAILTSTNIPETITITTLTMYSDQPRSSTVPSPFPTFTMMAVGSIAESTAVRIHV